MIKTPRATRRLTEAYVKWANVIIEVPLQIISPSAQNTVERSAMAPGNLSFCIGSPKVTAAATLFCISPGN